MEGVLQGFAGSFLLAWGTGWLRRIHARAARFEVGLLSYGMFMVLVLTAVADDTALVRGLLLASAAVVLWGALLVALKQESSLLMVGGEALAAAALVRHGVVVPFLTDPSGGYIYLGDAAALLTWGWILGFVILLKLANRLPGLFAGVLALLSFLLLGSLLYQKQHDPAAFLLLSILAGVSSGMWLNTFSEGPSRLGRVSCSLWAVTLGCLAIVTTSKKVATVAVLSPVGLGLAPLFFFSLVILRSYFLPRMQRGREQRRVIRMSVTRERLVGVLLLFCLLVDVLVLLVLFGPSTVWVAALSLLAFAIFARVASLVLLSPRDPAPRVGRTVEILGIPISRRTVARHLDRVRGWLSQKRPHLIITPDSLALLRTTEDPDYRRVLERADAVLPDGAGVIWAADFLHEKPVLERIPGIEFVQRLLELASETGARVFLLGTTPEVLENAVRAFEERFPELRIAGTHDGFFADEESGDVAREIRDARADICLVAMGVPKQELWMERWGERTGCKVLMGVGGSLDVLSGSLKRAPLHYQDLGLEWLYRILREPRRLMRAAHLPRFVLKVLEQKVADHRGGLRTRSR